MRKFQKLLALLLACLLLCGSLMACGGSGSDYDDDDDEKLEDRGDQDDKDKETKPTDPAVPEHEHQWSDWEIDTEATCAEEGLSVRTCDCGQREEKAIEKNPHAAGEWVVITKPSATADGTKALLCAECGEQMETESVGLSAEWTYETDDLGFCTGYSKVDGVYRDVILDSFGDNYYVCADGEEIERYANGYFISNQDGVQYLKKADGTVVCSTETLDVTGFGLTDNYEDYAQFLFDGYVLAYKITNTYNGTTFELGILGTDGQWIVPLSEEHPIITSGARCDAATLAAHHYIYAGDGILILPVYDAPYDNKLYNIKTNATYEINPDVSNWNLDYYLSIASFEDGVAYVTSKGSLYTFYADGTVTTTTMPDEDYAGFYVAEDGTIYTFGSSAIYINDEVHKQLDFTAVDAQWVGDAWLVWIKNPAGEYYYTYVTMDGQFLFDPVASDAVYICDVSGIGVGSIYNDGPKLVINKEGNVLYTSGKDSAYIYINKGVVYEEVRYAFSTEETYTFLPAE